MSYFVTVDATGEITGLYLAASGYLEPPSDAVPVTDEQGELLRNGFAGYKLVAGELVAPAAPVPTPTEQFKAIERKFEQHMDAVAQSKGYDNRDSCRLYAGYTNPFQAEATAFGQWVASTWLLAFQQQQDVVAGTRPMPTVAEALAEIPAMVWPV